jgi:hypothetical protein
MVTTLIVLLVFASGCTEDILTKTGVGNFGKPATEPSSFTCDYDENHLKNSPEFSSWFNTSCYYNEHCRWWESMDLAPKSSTNWSDCINCTGVDNGFGTPTPILTPCPVRTQKNRGSATPTAAQSSGNDDALRADEENRKVSFTIDCTMTKTEVLTGETEKRIVKMKGDVPFLMTRNWDKKPLIDGLQAYGSTVTGEGAKLDLYSEWDHACTSEHCVPCHYIYKGPVWIGATLMHDPKNAPSDWQVILLPSGETTNALGSGSLVGYVTNLEPSCPLSAELTTPTLVTAVHTCFVAGDWKHMPLNDGSQLIFTTNEPNVVLDSKAVFHISG